jgi:hypothetical protein
MSWYDQTAEQRERAYLPKYIARPPKPDVSGLTGLERREADWRWANSWELHLDAPKGGWGQRVRAGWEVRRINPERQFDFDRPDQQRRDEIDRWADGFINDTGTPGLIWPEDREAVLMEVARRLREATADGFLLRSLSAVASRERQADD